MAVLAAGYVAGEEPRVCAHLPASQHLGLGEVLGVDHVEHAAVAGGEAGGVDHELAGARGLEDPDLLPWQVFALRARPLDRVGDVGRADGVRAVVGQKASHVDVGDAEEHGGVLDPAAVTEPVAMTGACHDRRVSGGIDRPGRPHDRTARAGLDDGAPVHVPVHEDAGDSGVQEDAHAACSSNESAVSRQTSGSWAQVQVLPYLCGSVRPPLAASSDRKRSAKPNTTCSGPPPRSLAS